MNEKQKLYDIVIYGATGFTGKLICEKLIKRSQMLDGFNLAIAGRSHEKLEVLREQLSADNIDIIMADASNPESIEAMVCATKIVVTAVGPYQLYGASLVKACSEAGTDYIDLCGEPLWMREMIDAYNSLAKESGARILFSCGFDSIPSELGVWHTQNEAKRLFGKPMQRVRGRVKKFIGGPSGGSIASGMSTMQLVSDNSELAAMLINPFALTPGFVGPEHPSDQEYIDEPDVGTVGPFTLGPTDTKNVHRSNFLLGHPYGIDFVYDEMLISSKPEVAPKFPMVNMPKLGEGPSTELLRKGCFEFLFIASDGNNEIRTVVKGNNNPYEETALLVTETALCLLETANNISGIWTPVAALKDELFKQVVAHTGVSFSVE